MPGKKELRTIILAAGKGKRMKSGLAKVLHLLRGRPLLSYSIDAARKVGSDHIVVVIGHQSHRVRELYAQEEVIFIEQREQLGTGHAVLQTENVFHNYKGAVLIICGDVPLLKPATLKSLIDTQRSEGARVAVLTTILEDPAGYGRVIKGGDGEVLRIVEDGDATTAEKAIREINTGIYCVDGEFLFQALPRIANRNAQTEYYLTDIVEIAIAGGHRVSSLIAGDAEEVMGINRPEDLSRASLYLERHAESYQQAVEKSLLARRFCGHPK